VIDCAVNGLFSVIITLGKIPIIRCPKKGDSAQLISEKLDQKIREFLNSEGNEFLEDTTSYQRPVLIILDRDIDLSVMLSHSWTYQTLVHDLLNMKNNMIEIETKEKDKQSEKISYSFDNSDSFWQGHTSHFFPDVVLDINSKLEEFESKVGNNNQDDNQKSGYEVAQKIHYMISNLPELQETKRLLHMHTNIAFALLDIINERGINEYFDIEDAIVTESSYNHTQILDLILSGKGTLEDKNRLFLIYFIINTHIKEEDLKELEDKMKEIGCNLSAFEYIKRKKTIRS